MQANDQYMSLASKYEWGVNERAYRLGIMSDNKLEFIISPDGTYPKDAILIGHTALQLETWYHVAAVFDTANQTMVLYLNGELETSLDVPFNSIYNSSSPFVLGANQKNETIVQSFVGLLDEWQVYNQALDQTAIRNLIDMP